jgi:hypothetical protein
MAVWLVRVGTTAAETAAARRRAKEGSMLKDSQKSDTEKRYLKEGMKVQRRTPVLVFLKAKCF